jgi:hypothetical protein
MRIVKYFLFAALVFWTVAGCKKEKSAEGVTIPDEEVEHQWEFISDSLYKGTMDSALLAFSDSGAIIAMSGPALNGKGLIILQLFNRDEITTGKYENQNLLFQYSEDGVILFQNTLQQSDPFTITINSLDSASVSGVFSGVVQDGSGGVKQITEGKFSAPLRRGGGTVDSLGTLTVWATSGCPLSNKTEVTISDANGILIDTRDVAISATQPDCGDAGTTTFNLPAGDYFIGVVCGDTAKTKVTIEANTCTSLQLDFTGVDPPELPGDWFPLANRWTYGDQGSNDTLAIESTGVTTVDGKEYTSFTNDATGDIRYYRKDDTAYYESVGAFGGLELDEPMEVIFLKNGKPIGESWESEEKRVEIGPGLSVTGKLRMTITNSGFKAVINGKMYYDLIEVKTELLTKQLTGFTVASYINTVYAKGIGVVSYEDPADQSLWPILNYDVVP